MIEQAGHLRYATVEVDRVKLVKERDDRLAKLLSYIDSIHGKIIQITSTYENVFGCELYTVFFEVSDASMKSKTRW